LHNGRRAGKPYMFVPALLAGATPPLFIVVASFCLFCVVAGGLMKLFQKKKKETKIPK
jgi:hypothetical protein